MSQTSSWNFHGNGTFQTPNNRPVSVVRKDIQDLPPGSAGDRFIGRQGIEACAEATSRPFYMNLKTNSLSQQLRDQLCKPKNVGNALSPQSPSKTSRVSNNTNPDGQRIKKCEMFEQFKIERIEDNQMAEERKRSKKLCAEFNFKTPTPANLSTFPISSNQNVFQHANPPVQALSSAQETFGLGQIMPDEKYFDGGSGGDGSNNTLPSSQLPIISKFHFKSTTPVTMEALSSSRQPSVDNNGRGREVISTSHISSQSQNERPGQFLSYDDHKDDMFASAAAAVEPSAEDIEKFDLQPVSRLDPRFQPVFTQFKYFNQVQSEILDDILDTDHPLVVSAPTGTGKTVVFDLAIIRQLQLNEQNAKSIYIAPIKALCSERYNDWTRRFGDFGTRILELTGDTDHESLDVIRNNDLIVTTPEKLDSITRWLCLSDPELMMSLKLVMIDEVHMLNDKDRGHVLEAVVSRIKTFGSNTRFVAASATFPNVDDIALWLGGMDCVFFQFGEETRPVQLKKVVLGYPASPDQSEFRFEMKLSYKLAAVIEQHSGGAPTLVFCNTRRSTMSTASVLVKENRRPLDPSKRQQLTARAASLSDKALREMVAGSGVGFHHAGLTGQDRRVMEQLFSCGLLSVLTCTSTLALGVNLPAQLVVVKGTQQIAAGGVWREYSESQVC